MSDVTSPCSSPFRVGRIVFVALSRDETQMGFGYPKEEREALVASDPEKFLMPRPSDMRYNWVEARLDKLDVDEMRELVLDAWRMCVPKKVAAAYDAWPHPLERINLGLRVPLGPRSRLQSAHD